MKQSTSSDNTALSYSEKTDVCYHTHINIFRISEITETRLVNAGFFYDPFVETKGSYAPPNHYSLESKDLDIAHSAWKQALAFLEDDTLFIGYIESETLYEKFSTKYSERHQFDRSTPFPLPILKTVRVPFSTHKMADLHVKREGKAKVDELDHLMLHHGFYEVNTPRHRIYTLQTQHISDAKKIYTTLKEYFEKVGGIKQLNFEIVGKLKRFPHDFEVAKFLPKGFMNSFEGFRG